MGAKSKLVVFDFETGGLVPEENCVMEFCFMVSDMQTFEETVVYSELLQPYLLKGGVEPIYAKRALEVHGITVAQTQAKGITIKQFVTDCKKLFKSTYTHHANKPVLCGHNVVFDIAFLNYIFELCGEVLSDHVSSNNGEIIYWDTMQMSMQMYNTDPENGDIKFNLSDCYEREGLGSFRAHRAEADVRSTLLLTKALVNKMRTGKAAIVSENSTKELTIEKSTRKKADYFKF